MALWSDDLFLHGHGLARWITDYVDLEESLAIGSMSQESLAHAASLLRAAGVDVVEQHRRIFERPVDQWHASRLVSGDVDDWTEVVARGFLLTEGLMTLLDRLAEVGDALTADLAGVVRAEQALHARHWRRWVTILARDGTTRAPMTASLRLSATAAGDLFGLPDGGRAAGELQLPALHERWRRHVEGQLDHAGVGDVALPPEPRSRTAGSSHADLDRIVRRVREVRADNPGSRYEIYA